MILNSPQASTTKRYTNLILLNHMGAVCTAGLMLLFGSDSQYTSTSLIWTFLILPRRVWGLLFIASAVFVFIRPRAISGALFATILFMYGMSVLASVFTGDSESLSGWVWPALVGANMYLWTAYGRFNK